MRCTQLLATFAIASASFFNEPNLEELKKRLVAKSPFTDGGQVRSDAFDDWTDNEVHQWLSYHKLDPPDVTDGSQLAILARKHKHKLISDVKGAFDQAQQGTELAKEDIENAKDGILNKGAEYYQQVSDNYFSSWSDSALANYLSDRGEDIKNIADHDKLVELASQYKDIAIDTKNKVTRGWFDSWSSEDLKVTLQELGVKADGTRKQLADQLYETYLAAKKTALENKEQGAKNAQQALKSIEQWRKDTFDSWSVDDLKDYVLQFSPSPPSKKDQLVETARSQYNYFVYGNAVPPSSSTWGKFSGYLNGVSNHLNSVASNVRSKIFALKEDL